MKQSLGRSPSWLGAFVLALLLTPGAGAGGGGLAHAGKQSAKSPTTKTAQKKTKKAAKRPASKPAKKSTRAAHSAGVAPRDVAAAPRRAEGPVTPEGELERLLSQQAGTGALKRGTTSVYVVDAVTGAPVVALRPDDALNPASNVKLVSTATALDALGPEWRYATQVLGPAPRDGVVAGSIYLRGDFDPTLNASHIAALADDLVERGVRRVDGDLLVGTDPTRDGIFRAAMTVRVSGTRAGRAPDVALSTPTPMIVVENKAVTKAKGRSRIAVSIAEDVDEHGGPRIRLTVTGTVRAGKTSAVTKRVGHAGAYTAAALAHMLSERGVAVGGKVRLTAYDDYVAANRESFLPIELALHQSLSLRQLVAKINKRSINYLADRVVMTAGAAVYGGAPSMSKGVAAMHAWLDRNHIDRTDIVLDTGSGLSYQTELSARHIVEVLRAGAGFGDGDADAMAPEGDDLPWANEAYVDSLSIGGVDGTLRGRFKSSPARRVVHAKTGTLTKVIALSGLLSVDGRALAFAIVSNGHVHRKRSSVRKLHEGMVDSMVSYLAKASSQSALDASAPAPTSARGADEASDAPDTTDDDIADDEGGAEGALTEPEAAGGG